jgi:hypothetical protein
MPRTLDAAHEVVDAVATDGELELDAILQDACRGDEAAQAVLGYELYGLLYREAHGWVDDDDADTIANDILEMIAEGRIRARSRPRATLATVLRLAGLYARKEAGVW